MTLQNELYRVVHKTVRAQQVVEQHRVAGTKAERTQSPHDMNRQGLPLPSTPFNPSLAHRGIHVTPHTELMRFVRHSCRFMSCGLGVR